MNPDKKAAQLSWEKKLLSLSAFIPRSHLSLRKADLSSVLQTTFSPTLMEHPFSRRLLSINLPKLEADFQRNPLVNSEHVATFIATDLMRTAKGGGHRGSPFKDAMSEMMISSNVSNLVVEFLSYLGLCRSRQKLTVSSDKAVRNLSRLG
jgi:hypothetical protein